MPFAGRPPWVAITSSKRVTSVPTPPACCRHRCAHFAGEGRRVQEVTEVQVQEQSRNVNLDARNLLSFSSVLILFPSLWPPQKAPRSKLSLACGGGQRRRRWTLKNKCTNGAAELAPRETQMPFWSPLLLPAGFQVQEAAGTKPSGFP